MVRVGCGETTQQGAGSAASQMKGCRGCTRRLQRQVSVAVLLSTSLKWLSPLSVNVLRTYLADCFCIPVLDDSCVLAVAQLLCHWITAPVPVDYC